MPDLSGRCCLCSGRLKLPGLFPLASWPIISHILGSVPSATGSLFYYFSSVVAPAPCPLGFSVMLIPFFLQGFPSIFWFYQKKDTKIPVLILSSARICRLIEREKKKSSTLQPRYSRSQLNRYVVFITISFLQSPSC